MLSYVNPTSLTLDPVTANPRLVLSADRTSARLAKRQHVFPHNTKRFDLELFVLGSEGFTSGRQYWEVETGNKTLCIVGVAQESVKRKGNVNLKPESGYWVLWLFPESDSASFRSSSRAIHTQMEKQRKIGVFLDYEGGQVSFYNAGTMSHLHTFTHTFTERVFPFFSLQPNDRQKNKAMLKICGISGHLEEHPIISASCPL
ncbi:E3 ubiquitin-protein ligase TRIM69-like [Hemiscyllium ocellatum]|uniref:E3 ubiquitin-protein ligase TRIM69-like n=1 Tax=Hemiscyllium ocellatum TaxID=170820 RepID=UPI0029661CEF|nr:E3 ubiquitin-protein ligase TRIM69-like [Hemiscyllium ocellatum]